jgi:hypothetical protein
MSIILIVGCLLGLLVLAALIVGIVVVLSGENKDVVSGARQGWLNRRSEKDEEGG